MRLLLRAACGCHTGKIRKNNEDNFSFHNTHLEMIHDGLDQVLTTDVFLPGGVDFAVFDGMGGENFGEAASYTAAAEMKLRAKDLRKGFRQEEAYLEGLTFTLNDAVVGEMKKRNTERMGSTMALCRFTPSDAYVCSLGDSRVYRLHGTQLEQLSKDHVQRRPAGHHRKAPLTQYLGIDREEFLIAPHICRTGLVKSDRYLLCSDGLTDMLADEEIRSIMLRCSSPGDCVEALLQAALGNGGRDNITVIVCKVL